MDRYRLRKHPILPLKDKKKIPFYWHTQKCYAYIDEVISSALIANGISIFGHHHKDDSAQGIFCANGQCAKCLVIANGKAVKSCMTTVTENMIVSAADGLPEVPEDSRKLSFEPIPEIKTEVLIIGGGPAGLSAALELAEYNIDTIIVDDKNELGGKLVLQTHKFFGSVEDSYAGTRGIEIGKYLADEVRKNENVKVWQNSTALFVFSDKKVGILQNEQYKLVVPKIVLNAAGAREKFLQFYGNTLAGIYGAGAFQTLVNRDLVKPSNKLFIVGGGNVGLIAGYHAIQAGIEVVGLAEAMPGCAGYKVHADKLKRLGVSIYTSHTVLSANGEETISSVTIVEVDERFQPQAGTEKSFECDTLLIAVGLDPLDEFTQEAELAGLKVYSAGDANEIAEASSAMFNGKIMGLNIAKELGKASEGIPQAWHQKAEVLKAPAGETYQITLPDKQEGVYPVIHCIQEIPCNPCTTVCPTNSIKIPEENLMGLPIYDGSCVGCFKCLLICPGLAITLVDYRKDLEYPTLTMPYEISNIPVELGDKIALTDIEGNALREAEVVEVNKKMSKTTHLIKVKIPKEFAHKAVSFQVQSEEVSKPLSVPIIPEFIGDDVMICLCERVKAGDIRDLIHKGITDLNQIKAITRAGMGPCGAKTCETLIKQMMRQEGVSPQRVVPNTKRPVFIEVHLDKFAGGKENDSNAE